MNTTLQESANGSSALADTAALLGRVLLALIFILSGYGKVAAFRGTSAYITSSGLPFAEVLTALSILIELGGGIAIVCGWKAREAAALIFLWLIPVTAIFHNPLGLDPAQAHQQMIHLEKNLSIMGGLLCLFAFGGGRFALDEK